ncbi:ClpP/crotonase-like domain-containing protein [Penicillium verhagenii]|nr:ClpP/crotonase-like domain-containing protein [Penicillium verhagenii]
MALFSQDIKTGGKFTCAMPSDRVYVLVFESGLENHLTPEFVEAFCSSLSMIEAFPHGVVITASKIPGFYSKGISPHTSQDTFEGPEHIWPLLQQLLSTLILVLIRPSPLIV